MLFDLGWWGVQFRGLRRCARSAGAARTDVRPRYFFFSSKWQRLQRTRALTKQLHFGQRFSLRAILRFVRGRMTMSTHSSDHRILGGWKRGGKTSESPLQSQADQRTLPPRVAPRISTPRIAERRGLTGGEEHFAGPSVRTRQDCYDRRGMQTSIRIVRKFILVCAGILE